MTFPSDLEIARGARLDPVPEVAARMGIGPHLLEPYGDGVAKIRLAAIEELADRPRARDGGGGGGTPPPPGGGGAGGV
jgi:formate--tetrahydrofolate ligase